MISTHKETISKRLFLNKIKQFFAGSKSNQENFLDRGSPTLSRSSLRLQHFSPRLINKILMVGLGGLIIAVIYSGVNKRLDVEDMIFAVSKIQFQKDSEKSIEKFSPIKFYQEMVDKRDIFSPFMSAKKEKVIIKSKKLVKPKSEPLKIKISDLARDLKLVGISWGKIPKALIRSDKDNDTYFVRQGQRIGASDVRIKKIEKDLVIIKYKDQEMEL